MTKRKNESRKEYNERTRERNKLHQREVRLRPGVMEKERKRQKGARKLRVLLSGSEEGCGWSVGVRISRLGKVLPCVFSIRTHLESLAHAHKTGRQLGFHPISFEHPGCEWHHVNDNDVVQVPIHIHRIGSNMDKLKTEGVLG